MIGTVAWASVRRRLVSIGLIALAAALLFGGALGALAGARRSSTAIDRLLRSSAPEDVYVQPPEDGTFDMSQLSRLPNVVGTAYESYLAIVPVDADGHAQTELAGAINPFIYAPSGGAPDAIDHLRIVAGRDLDRTAPLEAVIDEELAANRGLRVGSHLLIQAYSADQVDTVFSHETSGAPTPPPEGPVLDLTVVGITRMPTDIHPGEEEHTTSFGGTMDLYLSPALYDQHRGELALFGAPEPDQPQGVRLVHGLDDLDAFTAAVHALPGGAAVQVDASDSDALAAAATARRAVSVETTSLLVLAAMLAVSGLVLVGHALARLARSATDDLAVLRAIGMRPGELLSVTALPGLVAMAIGAVGAVAVAIAASALTPIGLARQAEVAPGIEIDGAVLALGVVAVVVLGAALAVLTARPTARSAGGRSRPAPTTRRSFADRLAAAGAPFGPTIGARLATSRRTSQRSAPLRTAMTGSAVAIVLLVGVATYASSLQQLSDSRVDQGATWDVGIGNINLSSFTTDDYDVLRNDPRIAGFAAVAAPQGKGFVNGEEVAGAGFDAVTGGTGPRVLSGRLPTSTGEVALGQRTAARLGVKVGDHVTVGLTGDTIDAEVVGIALVGPGISPTMQMGDGALVTIEQLQEILPDAPVTFLLVDVKPGASVDETITELQAHFGHNVDRPVAAADVVNLERVRGIPIALALALGAAAVLLLAVALVLSVRQRRLDIGILRAIGASRRQLASALTWQALWLYGAAVVVGVPLGVIAGRLMWRRVADDLGALTAPTVPWLTVAAIAIGGLALVALLVVLPARAATRIRPGAALRTE